MKKSSGNGLSASFATGVVALVFLVTGYQTALLVHRSATLKVAAARDAPDTVYVLRDLQEDSGGSRPPAQSAGEVRIVRRDAPHHPAVEKAREAMRSYENFRFDPNTVSVADLQRLGFTKAQAESIDRYRQKGGRFRRPSDFAKSYVVADSVYRRLEKFIDIPLIDLNKADSAAFDTLPGIGPWFASKMVSFRRELGGSYSSKRQLLGIWNFSEDMLRAIDDLTCITDSRPYPLWTLPQDSLELHPFIGRRHARSIVLYRQSSPRERLTLEDMTKAGAIDEATAEKLGTCLIAEP